MNVLFISKTGDGLSLAQRVQTEGHNTYLYICNKQAKSVGDGMVEKPRFSAPVMTDSTHKCLKGNVLALLRETQPDLVVFDMVKMGDVAEYVMQQRIPVFGACKWADFAELDRAYGYQLMKAVGIRTPPTYTFTSGEREKAIQFVEKTKKRYVYKPSGNIDTSHTYVSRGVEDMIAMLKLWKDDKCDFELQEFVEGVEVSCFDDKTEVLTNRGWVLFKDIEESDEVLSINPSTLSITQHPINNVISYPYKGKMLLYSDSKTEFCVTPNHKMLIIRNYDKIYYGENTFRLRDASSCSLDTQHHIVPKYGYWQGKEQKWFILDKVEIQQGFRGWEKRSAKLIDMDVWCEFMGWWLSEGCTTPYRNTVLISQSLKRKENRQLIENILKKLPFHWNYSGTNKDFKINDAQLYNYLKRFGHAKQKFIPSYIFELSPRQIRLFLSSFLRGDGYEAHNMKFYVSTSKKLADGIQELILKCGSCANVRQDNNGCYVVGEWIQPHHSYIQHKHWKEIDYDGVVYCVNVEPYHTICVRRNGKYIWTGNCEMWWNGMSAHLHNWTMEEKKFMDGNVGPTVGCAGNVVSFLPSSKKLVREGIGKMERLLKKTNYKGPIDLNSIVTEDGLYGLEWTCRFGYDAVQTLLELYKGSLTQLLFNIATGSDKHGEYYGGVAIGVRISIPPYPHTEKEVVKKVPVIGTNSENLKHIWWGDIRAGEEYYESAGNDGNLGCVTARGKDVRECRRRVYRTINNLIIPQCQYRTDIGERVVEDVQKLRKWEYL